MIISINVNKKEEKIFGNYAKMHGCTVESALKNALLEKIEDEYDAALAELAYEDYLSDPQTCTHDELLKKLGI